MVVVEVLEVLEVLLVVVPGRVVVVVDPLGAVVLAVVDVDDVVEDDEVEDDVDEVEDRPGVSAREGTATASSAAAVITAPAPRRVEERGISGDLPPGSGLGTIAVS